MIAQLAGLLRPRLSLLNGVTALAGCLLVPAPLDLITAAAAFTSVTLLAGGGSALNQVFEQDLDSRMARTRLRPLPMRQMTTVPAAVAGASLLLTGILLLFMVGGRVPALLGSLGIFWYLAVYTPLKRRTSLALPIGALCGAFPPLIGWCLAGGQPTDFRVILLTGLLFLWQVPHFWLLQRRHLDDYQQAGIPLFFSRTGRMSYDPFFWLWLIALGVGAMLLPAFGIITRPLALWYTAFPLIVAVIALLCSDRLLFRSLNLFPLLLSMLFLLQRQL